MIFIKLKIIAFFWLIFISVAALAGFKNVAFDSGVAPSPSQVIRGSVRAAGGGVILRDVASCDPAVSDICEFPTVLLEKIDDAGYIFVTDHEECQAIFSARDWVLRTAIDLVDEEKNEVYRNVNLLGELTETEFNSLKKHNLSPDDVFLIEISPALANTKVGETLLTLDLLLTDVRHYSSGNANTEMFDEIENEMGWTGIINWTWTDEEAGSSFAIDCATNSISLGGAFNLALLSPKIDGSGNLLKDKNGNVAIEVFGVSEYFYNLIYQTNPQLLADSEEFLRVSAFMRFIKYNNPAEWEKIKKKSKNMKVNAGETPRMIKR